MDEAPVGPNLVGTLNFMTQRAIKFSRGSLVVVVQLNMQFLMQDVFLPKRQAPIE